jgi:hypothetical protein
MVVPPCHGSIIAGMLSGCGKARVVLDGNDPELPVRLHRVAQTVLHLEDDDARVASLRTLLFAEVLFRHRERLDQEQLVQVATNGSRIIVAPTFYAAVGVASLELDRVQGFVFDAEAVITSAIAARAQLHMERTAPVR